MAMSTRDQKAYRTDDMQDHKAMSNEDRRRMLQSYLPKPPVAASKEPRSEAKARRTSRFGVRRFLRNQTYVFLYTLMHTIFSLYIRIRQAWHIVSYRVASVFFYHHRSPGFIEKDVRRLKRKPHHLSVILAAEGGGRAGGDLERLINEAADIATWCACAGIPVLSIYERTGVLKRYMPHIRKAVAQKYNAYFGEYHPGLTIATPHSEDRVDLAAHREYDGQAVNVLLISAQDGRESMVDLTKTLAEMSQKGKLSPADINMDLIDAELSEGIMPEPDLLILFGPHVELAGYPPWQIRLTEIFCLPDNQGVGYQVFLRALRNFAGAQFRKGK